MIKDAIQVPTRVIIAEAQQQVRMLQSDLTEERRKVIDSFGLNTSALMEELSAAVDELVMAEAQQESEKAHLQTEYSDDRALAEKGYRFKLATDARVRAYLMLHPEDERQMKKHFRFGKLRAPRAAAVAAELQITVAELKRHKEALKSVGLDDMHMDNGLKLLTSLHVDQKETFDAYENQLKASSRVGELEDEISTALRQLTVFDDAAAAASPEEGRVFELSLVRGEKARVQGIYEKKVATKSEGIQA